MPSAMVGNNAAQSASPELGPGNHSEAMKQILGVMDKKVRNLEKKKGKLDDYQAKKNKGEGLNQDQLEALSRSLEVVHNLDFARELQKCFLTLGQDIQKVAKKSARREQLQREEMEQRRLKTVLELQFLLDRLGDDSVRQDLKQSDASGSPLLTEADLTSFDEFYKLVGPDRDYEVRLTEQYDGASLHLWELLEGRDKAVAGTTYKALKDTLDKVLLSGYFDRAQTHQNGVCEEKEEEEEEAVVVESKPVEQPSEPEGTATEEYTETVQVESTEFVNRQFIPETSYSGTDKDQVEEWAVEAQMVNSLQHQPPATLVQEPPHTVNQDPGQTQTGADPVVRKQAVQDLMAQMQGTYNFMQDSMLEFDGPALDPAIVSAQPMKPVQKVELQQMGCAPAHSEPRLPQTSTVPGTQESSQGSMASSSPLLYQPSNTTEPCSQTEPSNPSQVFNLNAPVPPNTDGQADSLKQPGQFPSGYGPGFSSQAEHVVDQSDIPQEALQSVVGGFQTQDQVMTPAAGHQQSSQGPGFNRSGQSFYNSRAIPRGGPRNARGMMNGYRGSSNGFRGAYDGYRAPFSNTPNSGYGQTQFNTPRDYSNSTYQREGYQQGYKRGAAQGPRGCSRGNAQAMRS